jgi:tetratricopeptide (TPR) repeat protein
VRLLDIRTEDTVKSFILVAVIASTPLATTPAQTTTPPAQPASPAADSAFAREQWSLARSLYAPFLKDNPKALTAHVKAGYADLALEKPKEALAHFEAVTAGAPASGAPIAEAGIALALAQIGDANGALDRLEKAVAVGYANLSILDGDRALRAVRSQPRFAAIRHRAELNAFPCLSDSNARAFDFWVGDWDVYVNGTNIRAGTNQISRESGGCLIVEHWTARQTPVSGPNTGISMNFIDPATNAWRQVWMGSGRGQNNFVNGKYSDGAMRFTFERRDAQGNPIVGRFTFYNLGPNRVRQLQETSRDAGASYQVTYDFLYVRKGSGEQPVRAGGSL